jgi:anti-sigma factor RsiW
MICEDSRYRRQIPLYEAGLLSPEENRRLETHLLECPACAQDLYEMQPVIEAIGEMRSPFEEESVPLTFWRFVRRNWMAVAAAATVAVVAFTLYFTYLPRLDWHASSMPTADINRILQDMSRHIREAYPPVTDGPDLQRSAADYQAGRYAEALALAQAMLHRGNQDSAVVLLAVRCHLALHQPDQALAVLADHPVGPGQPAHDDQLWLQSEALLRLRKPAAAVPLLRQLADQPGPYQASARELLRLLNAPPAP